MKASVQYKNEDKPLLTSKDFVNVEQGLGIPAENYDQEKSENECRIYYKNNGNHCWTNREIPFFIEK